ncbi:hypothetical protein ACJW30_04G100900 [Castanea mollissima]
MASVLPLPSSSSSSCCCSRKINAAIHVPNLPKLSLSLPKIPMRNPEGEELNIRDGFMNTIPVEKFNDRSHNSSINIVTTQLYAILEAVADRVEMHANIGEQPTAGGTGMPLLALKLSSTLLYSATTGMLLIMNKIQPSQLAEEQRNAARLFKQLQSQIQTMLAIGTPTQEDVKEVTEKVLALDEAYPLPLLGAMLEKFPEKIEPAVWWPKNQVLQKKNFLPEGKQCNNGWSEELEMEMREIVKVVERKDIEDYVRLGNLALNINKTLAISGPLLTGIAALGLAFVGHGSWAPIIAVAAGALASTVNAFEHGGQVGMVIEIDLKKRENGELFEMKVALKLGRSLSQLRELARKSASSQVKEFASKPF